MISMFVVVAGIFKGIVVQKHKNTWKIGTYRSVLCTMFATVKM